MLPSVGSADRPLIDTEALMNRKSDLTLLFKQMECLKVKLKSLGLSQYYALLVEEGFEDWDTIMLITEKDLKSLNVKPGDRNTLHKVIAENKIESNKFTKRPELSTDGAQPKRKYRRHAKPDKHAPARPLSAYVLFCNQIRNQLDKRSLYFSEKAKIAGQQWQVLGTDERAQYERHACAARTIYFNKLAEYVKTPQYAEYQLYLKSMEAKHGLSRKGICPPRVHSTGKVPQQYICDLPSDGSPMGSESIPSESLLSSSSAGQNAESTHRLPAPNICHQSTGDNTDGLNGSDADVALLKLPSCSGNTFYPQSNAELVSSSKYPVPNKSQSSTCALQILPFTKRNEITLPSFATFIAESYNTLPYS